jgi:ABC-2 type transport system permease protein
MNSFAAFVKKEFYHIIRDKRTVLILLVMPVVQIILFGFAVTTEVNNVQVAIFDPSKDMSTQQIIERFEASEYFTVTRMLSNSEDINNAFKEKKTNLVIVFSERFNENLLSTGEAAVQLIADATDPNLATLLTGYATSIILSYQQELMSQYTIPFQILPEMKMLYNPQMKSAYNFVPGVMGLILILICAMMTAIAIVREKETGTMEILLASPINPIYIIIAKAVPYFFLSVVNLTTIILLAVFVLEVPIAGSLFWLTIISLLFIVVSLSLGLLISTLVKTQVAAMLISGMALMMPVIFFSGLMFPIESMPALLQWLSGIMPARWYIAAIRKLMIQGVEIRYVSKELSILAAMALALLVVSIKKLRYC